MSEIIDHLKDVSSDRLQEELAKTYFSTTGHAKESHYTQSGQVRTGRGARARRVWFLVVAIVLALCLFTALFLFRKIEVSVKINPVQSSSSAAVAGGAPENVYFSPSGELNRDLIKTIVFYDNADVESAWGNGSVLLSNEIPSKRATLGIEFNKPVKMSENILRFYARGAAGGEEFRIMLKDANNSICYSHINELQSAWQPFVVDASTAAVFIDTKNIVHIGFEINPLEKNVSDRSKIFLKDICFTKRGG